MTGVHGHNPGCICALCKDPGLLGLPPCPVTGCDNCGSKTTDEDISWTQKGYGCSRCRTSNPLDMLNELGELHVALRAAEERARVAVEALADVEWGSWEECDAKEAGFACIDDRPHSVPACPSCGAREDWMHTKNACVRCFKWGFSSSGHVERCALKEALARVGGK